ncbi:hypothetical protein BD410DRAFT_845985 [Rickenella mellea]|uniref:Uncharacterized protein n=1 Tax=Rickenella mellea TaxID=50990 RepID=A0A4Y7PH79_9AGAM|nr:hypothetical protein BD410DRAFT_845985 [Rickenella mellea]
MDTTWDSDKPTSIQGNLGEAIMSVAFALYHASRHLENVQVLPLANVDKRATSACDDLNNCRTKYDIVWSCLTTMFACTWVAIHPNIPAPYESSFEIGLRRFGIVIMALIAPELVRCDGETSDNP